ncbi:MAG: DUF423 domain-containing protein [Rhodothermales bacterium]|nr:DUF423 domain-containing protein [Rhodothermales bacterium]
MSGRVFILIGSIAASISVLAGAFGAHALSDVLGERADVYETAARYHMYHALALVLVGLLVRRYESKMIRNAGWLFLAGIIVFSGSLYTLAITNDGLWGAVTPVGGVLFVAAWLMMGVGVWKAPPTSTPSYYSR